MKKTVFLFCITSLLFLGCIDENLPKASFDLYENTALIATPGDTEVSLNWEAAASRKQDGYLLTWSSGIKSAIRGDQKFGADEKSTVIKNLINGVEYTFSIQSVYDGKYSGKIYKKVTPITSRLVVENLVAAAGDSRVRLQWKKPESEKIIGYKVTVNPDGREFNIANAETTNYVITGLTNNQEYEFTVVVIYSNGSSEPILTKATPGVVIPILLDKTHYLTNQNIPFTYNEMYFMGTIKSVVWSFGDGQTSTDKSPKHAYTNGREYDVSVEVIYSDNTKERQSVKVFIIDFQWNYILKNSNGSDGTIKASNPTFSPDGNTVYIPSSSGTGDLHAINTKDGSVKWIFRIPKITYGGGPAIGTDGVIYQGAQDNNVYAINPDGSKKWQYNAGGSIEAFLAVTSKNEVYAVSNSNSTLHAIYGNGTAKWTKGLDGVPAAVAVVKNFIYAGTSTFIYRFDINGNELWKTPAKITERGAFAFKDNTLYATQKGGNGLLAIDVTTGAKKWTYKNIAGDAYGPIVGIDGTIYFTDKEGKSLYAIDSNGSEKWVFTTKYPLTYSLPAIDEHGIIYFGTFNQNAECAFYAVDSKNGTEVWKIIKPGNSNAEKSMAGVTIGTDKRLYVSTISGGLFAIPIFAGPQLNSWSTRGGNPQGTNSK